MSIVRYNVAIFGSTGSVGKQCLEVIERVTESGLANIDVSLLVNTGSNVELVIAQCLKFKPKYLCISNKDKVSFFKDILLDTNTQVIELERIDQDYQHEVVDVAVMAIDGICGAQLMFNFIKKTKRIAIANKESIVCCWNFIKDELIKRNCEFVPIDSEHNSIFQLLRGDIDLLKNTNIIKDIVITASGGPFFGVQRNHKVTLKEVISHPKWSMGIRNSINSANMVNKALEVIEAVNLFDIHENRIKAIIHPEVILHGVVNYKNGSSFAFMSEPDMKIHLLHGMFPYISSLQLNKSINLTQLEVLRFFDIDDQIFPAMEIARKAIRSGQSFVVAFNTTNEVAVDMFVAGQISFNDICEVIEIMLDKIENNVKFTNIESILSFDEEVRLHTIDFIQKNKNLFNN